MCLDTVLCVALKLHFANLRLSWKNLFQILQPCGKGVAGFAYDTHKISHAYLFQLPTLLKIAGQHFNRRHFLRCREFFLETNLHVFGATDVSVKFLRDKPQIIFNPVGTLHFANTFTFCQL